METQEMHAAPNIIRLVYPEQSLEPPREKTHEKDHPVLDKAAFYGLAGDFVRIVAPESEADPAALLVLFLVGAGNLIGRNVYWTAGARHYSNLFVVLIGKTGDGRKGSAWEPAKRLFRFVDEQWVKNSGGGLSSGEGLIAAVADPTMKHQAITEKGTAKITGYQDVEIDPGVSDKRLLVIEPEFSSVLKSSERQQNTLNEIIRQAWESGDLQTRTKHAPMKATGAHISIIGNITPEELLRSLDATDRANGFANRFLWLVVKRSQFLPRGGNLQDCDLDPIADRLREVIRAAQQSREIYFDETAGEAWDQSYRTLCVVRPGLVGAILCRAEAQTRRLAALYAVLDGSPTIKAVHLDAALALWDYCESSVNLIFGDRTGDPDTDAILAALRTTSEGLTRTDISHRFSRHLTAARIERALNALRVARLATPNKRATDGRSSEVWRAT
jgi:hypothetical protein